MNQIAHIVGNNYCYAIRCRRRRRRFFSLSFFDIKYYKAFVRTLITNLFLLFVNGKLNEKSKLLRCTSCSVCIFFYFTLFFQFYFIYYFCAVSRPTHCVETHTQTHGLTRRTDTHTDTLCVSFIRCSCACALVNSFCSAHELYCHE